jgi:DME family drug/metabolite transporter
VQKQAPTTGFSDTSLGLGAIGLAAALWAVAATVASNLFDAGVEPAELAASRSVVAAVGFALIRERRGPPLRTGPGFVIALGLSIALVNATYYLAIDRLNVAVAIVLQYMAPALVVLWVAGVNRRLPSRHVVAGVVAAIAGVILVSELPRGKFGTLDGFGISMGLASALLFATYTLLSEKVGATYGPLGTLRRAFPVAALFWIAYQSTQGWPGELFDPDNIVEVLLVGIGGTLAPFLLYLWGVQRVRAERATIAATLEPALAALIAWIWLDQTLSVMQIAGGFLIIGAVVAVQRRRPSAPPGAI